MCADLYKEVIRLVDISTFSRPKAVVMQSDRALAESLASILLCRRMNAESRTAADTIEGVHCVGHDRKAHKR
jgi:hypothetical protein